MAELFDRFGVESSEALKDVAGPALTVSNYVQKETVMTDKAEKRVTLRISPELHEMLLEAAYQSKKNGEGKSINQIGIEALELWLKTYGPRTRKRAASVAHEH